MSERTLKIIAHIHTDFKEKFGVPRQSGIVPGLYGKIVFTPEYRNPDALRGIEGFSHIWVLWEFSLAVREGFSPTVRPPRLGGNKKIGVFASRSPFRPNPIGLSSLRLIGVESDGENGIVLVVEGADMVDGTPIYDIKPYLPFTDSHPDAIGGYTEETRSYSLSVADEGGVLSSIPENDRESLLAVLSHDPRPSYREDDGSRIYGVSFRGYDCRFTVKDGVLFVKELIEQK